MGRDSKSLFSATGSFVRFGLIIVGVVGVAACGDSNGKTAKIGDDGGGAAAAGGNSGITPEDGGAGTTGVPGDDPGSVTPPGDGSGGSDPGGTAGAVGSGGAAGATTPPPSPWTDLAEPAISVAGGLAPTQDGAGREGGTIQLISRGAIQHDPALAPAAAPAGPAAGGEVLTALALAADVVRDGSIHVTGNVLSGGADAVRSITSWAGDIVIDGTLRGAGLGASTQGFTIKAPAGTVFISGTIETSGGTQGSAGGAISISARRIVVTGRIATRGGSDDGAAAAGAAGSITLTAAELLMVAGNVDASGGNAAGSSGGKAVGGRGGDLTLHAADVQLQGHVRIRGGVASSAGAEAEGGAAATLRIDADNAAHVGGIVDARGGTARAVVAGAAAAGAGGAVSIGATRPPQSIAIIVPLTLTGGAGHASGGKGGALTMEARGGDLRLAGLVDVRGGSSRRAAGAAGAVNGQAGPTAGGIVVAGKIAGNGGAIETGGAGDGGLGATVLLSVISEVGPLQVPAGGEIVCDGGSSGGTGRAGGGGKLDLLTYDGDVSMAGRLSTRGGTAPDPGGAGGLGGPVNILSDDNHNGFGGNLTIETSGVIDASGGPGTIGGSARNNGGGGVALFPDGQDRIAVLLNSDGRHGSPRDGALQNLGKVIARGAPGNGWGGDVIYHGRQPGLGLDPLPGHVEVDADGTGQPGEYVSE